MGRQILGLSALRLGLGMEFWIWLWVAVLGMGIPLWLRLQSFVLRTLPLLLSGVLPSGLRVFPRWERRPSAARSHPEIPKRPREVLATVGKNAEHELSDSQCHRGGVACSDCVG